MDRSVFKSGLEHQNDVVGCKTSSHLLAQYEEEEVEWEYYYDEVEGEWEYYHDEEEEESDGTDIDEETTTQEDIAP